jgi:hypothetical protein
MEFADENEVLATVRASNGRRVLGIVSLSALGILLIYIAFTQPPAFGWQIFLIATGCTAIWVGDAMRRATAGAVELTPLGLRDTDGTMIAAMEDIQAIDRGFFAFKPSNGFLIKTQGAAPNQWRPGLWWRIGRRIGIGGMTPGHQTKYMSEIIATLLARRETEA